MASPGDCGGACGWDGEFETRVFPHGNGLERLNRKYVERLVKFLLWQRGGFRVTIGGDSSIASMIKQIYSPEGERAFDYEFMGEKVYGRAMEVFESDIDAMPEARESSMRLGRNLDGCRIGFDLGGSDRKREAVHT